MSVFPAPEYPYQEKVVVSCYGGCKVRKDVVMSDDVGEITFLAGSFLKILVPGLFVGERCNRPSRCWITSVMVPQAMISVP